MDRNKIRIICRWLVALVFILSALTKLFPIQFFESMLVNINIAADRPSAGHMARLLVALELVLGIGLLQRQLLRRCFLPVTMLLLVAFSLYLVHFGYNEGWNESCGCFGKWLSMTPISAIIKNVVMLAMLGFDFRGGEKDPKFSWIFPSTLILVALAGVYAVSGMPRDVVSIVPQQTAGGSDENGDDSDTEIDVSENNGTDATQVVPPPPSPFAVFDDVPKMPKDFDMKQGQCLVSFFNPDCEHCKEMAYELGEIYRETESDMAIYFVFFGEADLVEDFFLETETECPYLIADFDTFFNFINTSPPELYLLQDGQARKRWNADSFDAAKVAEVLNTAK
ncbi:MAG: DoxX family protein [Lentisphaeria bacterium]